MRFSAPVAVIMATGLAQTAWAGTCEQPYSTSDLLDDLVAVESAAQGGDGAQASAVAARMEVGLGCLEEKVVKVMLGRTFRSIGAGFVAAGDEERGAKWIRSALDMDRNFEYGTSEYAIDHPFRTFYEQLSAEAPSIPIPMEGREFVAGSAYIDGRRVETPAASPDRIHLLQIVDASTQSWIFEGTQIPAGALVSQVAVETGKKKKEKAPKEAKARKKNAPAAAPSGVVVIRPKEKTPLLLAGSAIIAGAGGMFVGSVLTRQQFESVRSSEDELRKAHRTTNRLYVGSFALLAVGVGGVAWSVSLDGGTVMPRIQGRF